MRHIATVFIALGVLMFGATEVQAQTCDTMEEVTIDQLTAVPQANIDQLIALGASATAEEISNLLTNEFDNGRRPTGADFRCVRVTAVVLSDPRYSGLATWNNDQNRPGRLHVYIRDTAAETEGPEGMTIQIVDPFGATLPLLVGDVIEMEAHLDIFGTAPERAWQLVPIDANSIDVIDGVDPAAEWLAPISVTTDDINMVVGTVGGEPVVQANWANWNDLSSGYVRVEGAIMTNSVQADRPNWAFSSVGQESRVGSRDVSLRYRNDRHATYPPPPAFFTRPADDPFIPPPPGAVMNVQGFLAFGAFDAFEIGQPLRAFHFIAPITDEDLDVTSSPPIISVEALDAVPSGDFSVFATILPGGEDPLTAAELHYEFTSGASGTVGMTPAAGDDRYEAVIPAGAAEDGAFVTYYITASDGAGASNTSALRYTRVLADGITQIEHIQRTIDDGWGTGPFAGITTDLDIEGVLMSDPAIANIISIQDDPDLNPWSGVLIRSTEAWQASEWQPGDRIRISRAEIQGGSGPPAFNMTRLAVDLDDVEHLGSGEPYPYVTGIPTGLFAQDDDFARQYEGMAVRFDDVQITHPNPDAPSLFGEFAFSTGDPADQLRARTGVSTDASLALPAGHTMWEGWERLEYIQGIMGYTHGFPKLLPQTEADFGDVTTSSEPDATLPAITLGGAYPNPLVSSATISYSLAQSGHVRLEVFDITGRRVSMLVDGEQAAGAQEARFDAAAVASGVYIIRLTADREVLTTRVVVTR